MMRHDPGPLPLLARELTVAVQRRRTALIQVMTLLMTCFAAGIGAAINHAFGDTYRQGQDPFGRGVLSFALMSLAMMLGFVAPAFTATAITEERERRTLDLLLCTRLRPRDIILGKLLGGFAQGMLLVAASVPAVAFAAWWGGVTWLHVLGAYALVTLLLVMLLGLGLLTSSRAQMARQAVGAAYGIGTMLMLPVGMPSMVALAFSYTQGTGTAFLGIVGVVALVCAWFTVACVLGAITSISPVSRDPAPSARGNVLFIVVTSVVAGVAIGFGAEPESRDTLAKVLLGGVGLMAVVCAVLFLTEDPPARREGQASLAWRGHPVAGLAWLLAATAVGVGVVPGLALHGVAAPFVGVASCAALVPFIASVAGVASLTRLWAIRRVGRRFVAAGMVFLLLAGPPMLALVTGQWNLSLAPPWLMLWLHPVAMVFVTRPAETLEAAVGPFGFPFLASFVVGHAVLALSMLTIGLVAGKPAPRME